MSKGIGLPEDDHVTDSATSGAARSRDHVPACQPSGPDRGWRNSRAAEMR